MKIQIKIKMPTEINSNHPRWYPKNFPTTTTTTTTTKIDDDK